MTIYIEEIKTGYKYKFNGIEKISPSQRKPITSISLPTQPPDENIVMQLQGMQRTYDISFRVVDRDEDLSMGTAPTADFPDGVKTVEEQEKWLMDYVHNPDIEASWKIYDDTGSRFPTTGLEVVIEIITFDIVDTDPLKDAGLMRLTVGKQVV